MLNVFPGHPGQAEPTPHAQAVWIDLVDPDPQEIALVERTTGLHVPGLAELSEIESSSRLYRRNGTLTMSLPAVQAADTQARTTPVGVVLSRERLLTVRFARLRAFETFAESCKDREQISSTDLLLGLLEAIVDRLADVLERTGEELDQVSGRIFHARRGGLRPKREENELRAVLRAVGRSGDLISKLRDTLLGVGRLGPFLATNADWLTDAQKPRLETLQADIRSLTDYNAHLTNKVQFLLDATLGFISIEQNDIIKVLTIVSVVGVPPTFFASMYGMNFKWMPELDWAWGYPYALMLIVLSAVLPLLWFRWRGWL
ncbi:Magnesium transporter CorA family protein [Rhodovastum atsumiense]|nr:magnesium transporter CorA family protein [Rhodovastum atsumiense]CAH2601595.1 Magnesium transporter CorA family protein [Rhodovastum atsumiense]